jgi:hypothetical protein
MLVLGQIQFRKQQRLHKTVQHAAGNICVARLKVLGNNVVRNMRQQIARQYCVF